MRKINLYLSKSLMTNLLVAVSIATFVLLIGQFSKVSDWLSRGIPFRYIILFVLYRIPQALSFTLPFGLFISTILMFNKMSTDNEITALRSSGISLKEIIAPLILLSVLLSTLCYFLQFHWAPEFSFRSKWLVRSGIVRSPLQLLEAGRFVELFNGYIIYVGEKDERNVTDVHLYILDNDGKVQQKIDARRGELTVDESVKHLRLTLYKATIETIDIDDPGDLSKNQRIKGDTITFPLDYGGNINKRPLVRRTGEMAISQLFAHIQIQGERGIDTTPLYVELHLRAAMALSPFSFLLIGIPLGIRLPRKESNVALMATFLVPLMYYVLVSFFETLRHNPEYKPEFLMWTPNIICQIVGISALWLKR